MAKFRAIHTVDLKPSVDKKEFEEFMLTEFIPQTLKLPGCLDIQLLKGYRGDRPGVATAKSDYAWISLWESVEANNEAWSKAGEHFTPESIEKALAKLYTFAAAYWLIGGYTVVGEER
jgi:heme-degrading monooxygenase HmoA